MRNRRRWLFVLVLVGGLAGFSGLWYATSSGSSEVEPDFGGAYVEGMAGVPSRVNPLFASRNAVDQSLAALVFAGLTSLDDQGRPFPDLAETWSTSADGLEYVFVLRPGLFWHDGAPLTAADVVFTYALLQAPGLRTDPGLRQALSGVEVSALDGARVRFQLAEPYAPLPGHLTLGLLPEHILGGLTATEVFDHPFNQQPVGAGPYRLEELTPGRAVLTASPTYHLGHPFIPRFELRFFPDEGRLLAALRQGALDGALFSGLTARQALNREQRQELRLLPLSVPAPTYVYLDLGSSVFADRRVRQALLLAVDRQAIIDQVLGGEALKADSLIAPGCWAYEATLGRYDYDPGVAALLLDEAGWRLAENGVRARAGRELAFRLQTNDDPVRIATAERLAEAWRALGLQVAVDVLAATTLVREVLEPRDFEAALFSAGGEADPDPFLLWHSSQAGGKGLNLSSLADARFDALILEARATPSQPRREELYHQLQELFAQEVPAIPLYTETALYAHASSLRGVRLGCLPDAGARFWQVQEWHLKTR